ncbi:MAG: CHASE2 domain-containing protein [Betaproteobacteria bacterium]|nr:CHASE2 domain-containing protein [Betaproteobacteria bacterium]
MTAPEAIAGSPAGGGDRIKVLASRLFRYLGVPLIACAIAAGVAQSSWLQSLENVYYDYWHVLAGVRYAPRHAAFVSVDDDTLTALKDDPLAFWAPHFGRAMDVLSDVGVKAVGLDFIYQVSAESWLKKLNLPDNQVSRNYDAPLRAALARGDKVLIPHLVELNNGELSLLLPPQDHLVLLPRGIHDLDIANLNPDDDKHVRRFYPVMVPEPGIPGYRVCRATGFAGPGNGSGGQRVDHRGHHDQARTRQALDRLHRAFRNHPEAVDERAASARCAGQSRRAGPEGQGGHPRREQCRQLRPAFHALFARFARGPDGWRRDPRQHRRNHALGPLPEGAAAMAAHDRHFHPAVAADGAVRPAAPGARRPDRSVHRGEHPDSRLRDVLL